MQMLRNLRLAARLGVAFGALALGLLVVSVVAFSATDGLDDAGRLARRRRAPVHRDRGRHRRSALPEEAHLLAQHLYVHDGDLAAQDEVAAEFGRLAAADDAAFGDMIGTLEATRDATSRGRGRRQAAAPGARRVHRRRPQGAQARRARRRSTASRTASSRAPSTPTRSSPRTARSLAAVGENAKGTVAFAAAEGDEAHGAIAATKRAILIAALLSGLVALALAVFTTRSVDRVRCARSTSRLDSLDAHCLQSLSDGLQACADGDLTRHIEPVTTPMRGHVDRRARPPVGHVQRHARQGPHVGRVLQRDAHAAWATRSARSRPPPARCPPRRSRWRRPPARRRARSTRSPRRSPTSRRAPSSRSASSSPPARRPPRRPAPPARRPRAPSRPPPPRAPRARWPRRASTPRAPRRRRCARSPRTSQEISGAIEELSARSERIGGIVDTITGHRRADQPAGAERRDRGRPRRRAGPRLRGRRRGGAQARRGVAGRRRARSPA